MNKLTHERFPAYVPAWNRIAWFKEFPHLNKISCYHMNNFFDYYYDVEKHNVGVLKLQFSDGDFVLTSSKTSLRKRISEIVSNAVTFSEYRKATPLDVSVGVRLYKRERIKVYKLSDNPEDKKQIQKELSNGKT